MPYFVMMTSVGKWRKPVIQTPTSVQAVKFAQAGNMEADPKSAIPLYVPAEAKSWQEAEDGLWEEVSL